MKNVLLENLSEESVMPCLSVQSEVAHHAPYLINQSQQLHSTTLPDVMPDVTFF